MSNKELTRTFAAAVAKRAIAGDRIAESRIEGITDIVRRSWLAIKALIKIGEPRADITAKVKAVLRAMTAKTEAAIEPVLIKTAEESFDSAFAMFEDHLPAEWWGTELLEAERPKKKLKIKKKGAKAKGKFPSKKPKQTPSKVDKKTAAKRKEKIKPKKSATLRMVRSRGWKSRIRKWSKKVTDLDKIAEIIAKGIEEGKKFETIVNAVRPHVDSYASSARRLVRTEMARIENRQLEKTYESFGDVIIGFQIMNPLDERTRPEHRKRAGRIYWKDNRRRYKADQRPELPDAPNCRCCYGPVFRGVPPKLPEPVSKAKKSVKRNVDKTTFRRKKKT